jgi:hypothetical protein
VTASNTKAGLARHPTGDAMFCLGSNNSMYDRKPGLRMIWCMLVTQEVPSGLRTPRAFQKAPGSGVSVEEGNSIRSMGFEKDHEQNLG